MGPSSESSGARTYRPIVELGRGGMAEVYLAVAQGHAGFNKLVVLKKTRTELSEDPEFISMFLDEARLAARLSHPNVVQTYEVGQDGDRHFIAMEYLEGQPLSRVRHRSTGEAPFPLPLALRVLADALAGLHYAHELTDFDGSPLGIVHRDVTPHNVFVTYDGHVKIVDFGIAKAAGASVETRHGTIKGKLAYMPPEQATARALDRRADLFAVGVMLWEAVSGVRMWRGVPELMVLHHLAHGEVPRLRDVMTGVAPALERVLDRALAPSPGDRYATAAEMQAELEDYLDTLGERSSSRQIAEYMSARFHERRAEVKQLIEAQLGDVRWSGPASSSRITSLPRLDALPESSASSSVLLAGAPPSAEGSSPGPTPARTPPPPAARLPAGALVSATMQSVPPPEPGRPTADPGPSAASDPDPSAARELDPSAARELDPIAARELDPIAARERDPIPAARRARIALGFGGGALLVLLAVGLHLLSSRPPPPSPGAGGPLAAGSVTAAASALLAAAVPPSAPACAEGMALIPGGRFSMGSDEPGFDLWKPVRRVTIDTFCLDLHEVTAGEYKACADAGPCARPDPIPNYPPAAGDSEEQHEKNRAIQAELCNFGKEDRAKHPINCVSWDLADGYCRSRKGRLPTEAEWEYAARGSDSRKYPWGNAPGAALHMNVCGLECNAWERSRGLKPSPRMFDTDDGHPGTAPVGSFPAGKAAFGVEDLVGNVWEWTFDWFETYKPGDAMNPKGAVAGNRKAIRGGGYNGSFRLWVDPAFRYHQLATASAPAIGFRCAADLPR